MKWSFSTFHQIPSIFFLEVFLEAIYDLSNATNDKIAFNSDNHDFLM